MKHRHEFTRREFLKGAGAAAAGTLLLGWLGPGAMAAGDAPPAPGGGPADRRTVLAFASDTHAETPGFEAWLRAQQAVYGEDLAHLSFGGDICDKAWVPEVFDGFKAVLDELMPGKYAVTTGNQENKPGAPGPQWDDMGPGFLRLGEAVHAEDYRVYHLGAAQESMAFPPEDIQALADYLEYTPGSIPVFVVSHYPLHLSVPYASHDIPGGFRQAAGSDALTEVLNRHPNVIFLWGHNHTFKDPRYGTIRPAGSKFTWDHEDPTKKLEIGFTYANMGSFCRGDTYGAIAEVARAGEDIQVTMYYVDTDVPMPNKESAVITFRPDGTVSCDTAEPPEGSINFIDMYYLAGWYDDPHFMEDY